MSVAENPLLRRLKLSPGRQILTRQRALEFVMKGKSVVIIANEGEEYTHFSLRPRPGEKIPSIPSSYTGRVPEGSVYAEVHSPRKK